MKAPAAGGYMGHRFQATDAGLGSVAVGNVITDSVWAAANRVRSNAYMQRRSLIKLAARTKTR